MLLDNNTDKVIELIEMLFNIYETDFKDKNINKQINKHLYVYDYCYDILNK